MSKLRGEFTTDFTDIDDVWVQFRQLWDNAPGLGLVSKTSAGALDPTNAVLLQARESNGIFYPVNRIPVPDSAIASYQDWRRWYDAQTQPVVSRGPDVVIPVKRSSRAYKDVDGKWYAPLGPRGGKGRPITAGKARGINAAATRKDNRKMPTVIPGPTIVTPGQLDASLFFRLYTEDFTGGVTTIGTVSVDAPDAPVVAGTDEWNDQF